MNKCQDILKIVRGNAFTLCLQIEARRPDGSAVDGFALEGDEMLNLLHNGESDRKTYERVGNSVFVTFDGDDELGWYGLEMTGVYADEQWRWCVPRVFQIVETNERANLPGWTILAEDTYVIGCGITLLSAVVHADWDVNDPTDPSYIKNKPDLNEFALATDLLATNQRVTSLENNTVKTVRQVLDDTMKATARDNISAASVAQLNAKQDSLTAGDGISIENNVISATGEGGGGITEIEDIMPIVFGTYNESTGAYDNTYLMEDTSGGASWLYDIAPHIHQEMWSGSSEEATFRVSIDIEQGATNVYGSVLAYITPTDSHELKVSFSFEGVNYVVLFDVQANHATTTATKLSHLVANEENKFYDTGLYLEELVPSIGASTYEKLSALRMSNAYDKMLLIRGFRSRQRAGTYAVATVKFWGSTFEFYVDDNGTTVHVQGDSLDNWTITRTTPYTKPNTGIPSTDLSTAVQTSLGKADSALQEESVFIAEYGVTTATEIQNAYAAGKTLFCKRNAVVYGCVSYSDTWVYFGNISNNQFTLCSFKQSDSSWSNSNVNLENVVNKKTTITGNESSTTYYPTTKAVADYVSGIVGNINTILDEINGEVI